MIEFKAFKNKYIIEPLTIRTYNRILDIDYSTIAGKVDIVSALSGCPNDVIMQFPQYDFVALWKAVYENILNITPDESAPDVITLNKIDYHLTDLENMSGGLYSDIDLLKAMKICDHKILSILYRPKYKKGLLKREFIEEYDADVCLERSDDFLDIPMSKVKAIEGFFLDIVTALSVRMLDSLGSKIEDQAVKEIIAPVLQILPKDGFPSSITSQGTMHSSLTRQELSQYVKRLTTPRTSKIRLRNKTKNKKG